MVASALLAELVQLSEMPDACFRTGLSLRFGLFW